MIFDHSFALHLERVVRRIYDEEYRGAFGGLIDADTFESHPFYAAIIGLAPYYKKDEEAVSEFMGKYRTVFDYPDENKEVTAEEYCRDLEKLIEKLSK